jgi:amino acid transporter
MANSEPAGPQLQRHFGLLQATALNISMIVGAGIFITTPLMLGKLPGPYALLGWLVAGVLIIVDGMIWSELGATLPGSGGTYQYLLEAYGRETWGRLMAFLFVWQFLISGPLEVASGLIAIATFSNGLGSGFKEFNEAWTWQWPVGDPILTVGPGRLLALLLGLFIIVLLYRRVSTLGRLTVTIWIGVLLAIGIVLVEGVLHFDASRAFDFSGKAKEMPDNFVSGLGGAMRLALYAYFGYYTICYVGDEVCDPGKTIPRSILLSAVIVCVLFAAVHLAFVGVVPWQSIPTTEKELENYSLPAEFMKTIHGEGFAPVLITLLLIWSSFGSAFAGLLGYSRIPYGAAQRGHFLAAAAQVHPRHRIPHVSLLLVGGLTLFWSFFNLQDVIDAMIVTRILEQFLGQVFAVMLLRKRPDLSRPYRMWLYPLPCLVALVGWLFVYLTSEPRFIILGLATLLAGMGMFLFWSWRARQWPFGA